MFKRSSLGLAGLTILLSVFFSSVAFPAVAKAELWTPNGSNIYYNNGNVGIGTVNPVSKLDVRGDITISNNNAYRIFDPSGTPRVGFQMDTLGNQLVGAGTVSTGGDLVLRAAGFPGGAMRIKANTGDVGIGTAAPESKLDVRGNVNTLSPANPYATGLNILPTLNNTSGSANALMYGGSIGGYANVGSSGADVIAGLEVNGLVKQGSGTLYNSFGLYVNQPSGAQNNVALYVAGNIGTNGSAGTVTSQSLSTPNAWYTQSVTFLHPFGVPPRVTLTQDNSGSGDISIISLRVKKNSVTTTGFTIDYYVNAIPTNGTTKFNWTAFQN